MKRQIRHGVFETNSSSVHSLTMCSQSEYDKWVNGEYVFDRWSDRFVDSNSPEAEFDEDYLTYEQFNDWGCFEYETFVRTYETIGGEKVVAFGYYGYN